jgi:hypothetical protein
LPATGDFCELLRRILPAIELLAAEVGTPPAKIEAKLADDFTAEVEAAWFRAGIMSRDGFTVERIGGQVRGEESPARPDGSVVEIVFDGRAWPAAPTVGDILEQHWLVAMSMSNSRTSIAHSSRHVRAEPCAG